MGCTQSKEKEARSEEPLKPVPVEEAKPVPVEPTVQETQETYHEALNSKYKMCGPSIAGEVLPVFKTGLLFRITTGSTWAYYNDSQDYEMHVDATLKPGSDVTLLGSTTSTTLSTGEQKLHTVIYPGVTELLCEGKTTGFNISASAKPLSAEYRQRKAAASEARVNADLDRLTAVTKSNDIDEILEACVKHNVKFVDTVFKASQASMSRECDGRRLPLASWERPTDYLPERLHKHILKFRDIEPNDIDQGQLGDCWLLCSIAAVAEHPRRIERLFLHPKGPSVAAKEELCGAYSLMLNSNGWWTRVIVDDYLPVIGGKPCFAKNVEDPAELWASLIEKAYAKINKSYAAIAGGDALHALFDLTGYPTNRFDTEWEAALASPEKSAEMFQCLARYDAEDYITILNTPGVDNSAYAGGKNDKKFEEKYKAAGLGMGHAYSVLEVKEFDEGFKLLKIRNPWGNSTEWTGAWSDDDAAWIQYPHIAAACNHEKASDGTFWMSFEDVKKYFDGGGVCFSKFNWIDYRVRGVFRGVTPSVCFEVNVTKPVRVFIVMSQRDKRGQAHDSKYKYAPMMISVSRQQDTKQIVHLNSTTDADAPTEKYTFHFSRDHALLYTFEPQYCPYLVIPRIYQQTADVPYVLGMIAESPVSDAFKVTFKQLESTSKAFDNFPKFVYDSNTCPAVAAEYQRTTGNTFPETRTGNTLSF